jgi:hypothetical protein
MTDHQVREKARVALDLRTHALVQGDAARVAQVVINLLLNASQAFLHWRFLSTGPERVGDQERTKSRASRHSVGIARPRWRYHLHLFGAGCLPFETSSRAPHRIGPAHNDGWSP